MSNPSFHCKIGAKIQTSVFQSADKPTEKLVRKPTAEPTIAAGFLRGRTVGFKAVNCFMAQFMARLGFMKKSLSP